MRDYWRSLAPERKRRLIDGRDPQRVRAAEQRRRGKRVVPNRTPEKKRATQAVYRAIKRGDLERGPCEVCGAESVQAHHDDYSKPLEVRWLCRKHHGAEHRIYEAA